MVCKGVRKLSQLTAPALQPNSPGVAQAVPDSLPSLKLGSLVLVLQVRSFVAKSILLVSTY